jgi:hypothetical protein
MRNLCDLLNFIAVLVIGYMKTIRASTDIYICETDNIAYLGDIKTCPPMLKFLRLIFD